MNQQTNNSVLLKRFRGWLALMMAVTMLFGSSMTVFAEEYEYNVSNVGNITTGMKYYGGDEIRYEASGSIEILVYVNDEKRDFENVYGYRVVTLSGDESVVYTVSEIYKDGNLTSLKMLADIPKTKYLYRGYNDEDGSVFVKGISVGDTLSAGDSIKNNGSVVSGGFNSVTLIVDGAPVNNAWGDGNTYTFDKDVTVTGVECDDELNATITFNIIGSGSNNNSGNDTSKDEGEDCDHTGEDCTHKDNDADSDEEEDCDHTGEDCTHKDNSVGSGENKEEPKAEEPKENEEQVFTRELLESVVAAKAGDNMAVDATLWHSFNANVLKELLSKEGVSYTFYYNYGGECFYITIPAGAVLEEGCEWYGPLKLNAMFGRTMIDKKDLHAAINK